MHPVGIQPWDNGDSTLVDGMIFPDPGFLETQKRIRIRIWTDGKY